MSKSQAHNNKEKNIMTELQDINAVQCEADYNCALQECSAEFVRITDALKGLVDTPATWPRVGSLLAVRDALKQAWQIQQAALRG